MFTKTLKASVLIALLWGLSGCGLKMGEDIPPTPEISASVGMSTECFTAAGTALNDFFKGTATDIQIHSFWNCLSFSVSEFEKNTHGKTASLYTGRELANFFERYFLKNGQSISPTLMTEVFRMKKVFVGGNLESISRTEMFKAIEIMEMLKKITLKVNPHMKIFNLTGKADLYNLINERAKFVQAEQDLLSAAKSLSLLLKSDYPIDAFATFFRELDPLLPAPTGDQTTMTEKSNRYLPLILTYKNVLFTDTGADMGDTVGRSWEVLLNMSAKIFARYAYYQYFIAGQNIENNEGALSLKNFALSAVDTLDEINARKPKGKITPEEYALLANRLETAKLLPGSFSAGTIQQTMSLITNKFTTANIKSEVNSWYNNQISGVVLTYLQNLFFDETGRLSYMPQHRSPHSSTMFKANLVSSVLRLIVRTYTTTGSTVGLTETEVDRLYQDFKPLAVALKVVAPSDTTFGLDRARDANLFTPQGNGDSTVTIKEGTDLVMMLMSGMERDEMLREGLSRACSVYKINGFWGDDTTNNTCARDFYLSKLALELQLMPKFYGYVNSLSAVNRVNITNFAFAAAGAFGTMPKFIKLANIPQVFQYIEVIFNRFDTNGDNYLDPREANVAWPVFREMMLKYSGQSGEDMNHAIFGYMLRHGSPPDDASETADFLANWRYRNPLNWSISADRARLLQVMGYIASLAPQ